MLNLKDFRKHYKDAVDTESEEIFIAEPGWEDWMSRYDTDAVISIMKIIFKLSRAKMDINELRKIAAISRIEFSRMFSIPPRTVDNWTSGVSNPSEYLFFMIAHEIFINMYLGELWEENEKI